MPRVYDKTKLTAKQKLFCEEYVANGYKLQQAYLSAFPNSSPRGANAHSWELMKDERIKKYIEELQHDRFEALHVNADRIANELTKMAFAELDVNNTNQTKAKALELLQKQLGLQNQNINAKVQANVINVTIGDEEEEDGD